MSLIWLYANSKNSKSVKERKTEISLIWLEPKPNVSKFVINLRGCISALVGFYGGLHSTRIHTCPSMYRVAIRHPGGSPRPYLAKLPLFFLHSHIALPESMTGIMLIVTPVGGLVSAVLRDKLGLIISLLLIQFTQVQSERSLLSAGNPISLSSSPSK